jgi:hydrogenase expression/formation protein HypE
VGALGIYGTVNDLAVVGATPRYISTAFIIEEGFSMTTLKEVVHKMHQAAVETNVAIITGDTKVVPKGFGGSVYINTTGAGDSQDTPI